MLLTMYYFGGIGLAAPQVGITKKLIVVDIGDGPVKLANPEIVQAGGIDVMEEGCLSIPEVRAEIERSYDIVVKGAGDKGEDLEVKANGLLARVLQHEIDHLNGKLIVDYIEFFPRIKAWLKSKRRKDADI